MKEYFSHDHNARNDRKVIALVDKYKSAGYGIFWATNEMMHEEGGELEFDQITFGAIAKQLNEESSFIETVITDCINIFKLYILSGEKLTSNRVKRNITGSEQRKLEKSEKYANSGRLGGIKSGESRRTKQTLEANEAMLEAKRSNEAKEKKSIESKEKESNESKLASPESFPDWKNEALNFINNEPFKKDFIKIKKIGLTELEYRMWEFVLKLNEKMDFKNEAALKVHFKNSYAKHIENGVNGGKSLSNGFVEVPADFDYNGENVVKW